MQVQGEPLAAETQVLIEKIAGFPAQLRSVVAPLTTTQLTTAYLTGEWTVAQIVHHLADAHSHLWLRIKFVLTEDRPALKVYNQNLWAQTPEAGAAAIEPSLEMVSGLHRRASALLASLDDAAWRRVGLHPERGELTVVDLARLWANHGEAHLAQIVKTLAAGQGG